MKKYLLLLPLLFVFILAGCQRQAADTATTPSVQAEQPSNREMQQIATAIQSGQALKCTITEKDTGQSMEYGVQGKNFRMDNFIQPVDTQDSTQQGHVLSDGQFFYSWTTPANTGFKMQIPDEEAMKEQYDTLPDFSNEEALREYEQNYTLNCDPTSFPNGYFTAPTNVQFQDMTVMMENVLNQAQQGMSEEQQQQLEEAMKKYGQQ